MEKELRPGHEDPLAAVTTDDEPAPLKAPNGTELMVELEGVYGILKSELVGQRESHYLIIRTPLAPPGISSKLFKGNRLIVRYTDDGIAYGFHSTILVSIKDPEPLLFLAPPTLLEEKSLRRSQRIDAHLPCLAAVRDKSTEGTIVDISVEGCRCLLPTHLAGGLLHLHLGDTILLEAELEGEKVRMPGKIRSVTALQTSAQVGIHFEHLTAAVEARIIRFLADNGVEP